MQNVNWNLIAEQESVAYKTGFLNALQMAGVEGLGASGRTVNIGAIARRVPGRNGGAVGAGIYANVVPTVLAQHPGCTLTELFDYAKSINPNINRNGLQAYLATAKKSHLLRARGSRGHMKYSLAGKSVAT